MKFTYVKWNDVKRRWARKKARLRTCTYFVLHSVRGQPACLPACPSLSPGPEKKLSKLPIPIKRRRKRRSVRVVKSNLLFFFLTCWPSLTVLQLCPVLSYTYVTTYNFSGAFHFDYVHYSVLP